jgi:hypothetical protein
MGTCLQLYNSQGGRILVNIRSGVSPSSTVPVPPSTEGTSLVPRATQSPAAVRDKADDTNSAIIRLSIRLSDGIAHKMAIADDGQAKCLTSVTTPFIISEVTVSSLCVCVCACVCVCDGW